MFLYTCKLNISLECNQIFRYTEITVPTQELCYCGCPAFTQISLCLWCWTYWPDTDNIQKSFIRLEAEAIALFGFDLNFFRKAIKLKVMVCVHKRAGLDLCIILETHFLARSRSKGASFSQKAFLQLNKVQGRVFPGLAVGRCGQQCVTLSVKSRLKSQDL